MPFIVASVERDVSEVVAVVVVVSVVFKAIDAFDSEIETIVNLFSSSFDSASLFLGLTGRVRITFSMLSITSARGVVSS